MNRSIFKIVIVVLCFFSFSVSAQPKMDLTEGIEDTLGAVSSKMEEVQNKVNTALKKVLEFKEKVVGELKALKEKVDEVVDQVKERVDEIKERVDDVKERVDEAKDLYEEGKEMYEEGKEMYESAKQTGEEVASSIELKKRADELKKKMDDRKTVVTEELTAKLKSSQTNEQTYQQLYDETEDVNEKDVLEKQLSAAKLSSIDLKKNLEDASKEGTTYFESDEEYAKLQQEYQQTMQELDEVVEKLKEKGKSIGSDFASRLAKMSPAQKKAEYSNLIGDVFVGAKEKLDAKAAKKVKTARRNKLINAASNMFVLMTKHQSQSKKLDEDNDKAVDDCEKSDSLMTKLQLVNELNVSKNDLLFDNLNTNAGLIELKATTDMLSQDYKLGNPDKNPAELDLDSYVLKEEDLKEHGLGKAD